MGLSLSSSAAPRGPSCVALVLVLACGAPRVAGAGGQGGGGMRAKEAGFQLRTGEPGALGSADHAALAAFRDAVVQDPTARLRTWDDAVEPCDAWRGVRCDGNRVTRVEVLDLTRNRVSGTLPAWLADLPALHSLLLQENGIGGTLPPELGSARQLTALSVGTNQLTGTVPQELLRARRLTDVLLAGDLLSGTMPQAPCDEATELRMLDLRNNQLTGTVSAGLGACKKLRYLHLEEQELTGTIPPELGNATKLLEVHLQRNRLWGDVPESLAQCTQLRKLLLHQQKVHGRYMDGFGLGPDLPATVSALPGLEISLV